MHPLGWFILSFLILSTILEVVADLLNLKSLKIRMPEQFQGWYDPERYATSQRYLRTNTRFGWVVTAFHLSTLLVFWFCGGFAWLDLWV